MRATGQVMSIAAAFGWLGMALAISFLEAPLKRAPDITPPLEFALPAKPGGSAHG